MKYSRELATGKEAIAKASKILMRYYSGRTANRKYDKGENDIFTEADLAAEKVIIATIRKKFPAHDILSEEAGEMKNAGGSRWIIDPLDGTHNFYFGLPMWGTMLAFEADGKIEFSVISLPIPGELYVAIRGGGSTMNGKKIHVSNREEKFLSSFGLRDYNDKLTRKKFDAFATRFHKKFRVLGSISVSGSLISTGRMDAQVATKTLPWDIAPVALLIEEAGGKVTDLNGQPWNIYQKNYVMSNGKIHKILLETVGD